MTNYAHEYDQYFKLQKWEKETSMIVREFYGFNLLWTKVLDK